MNYLEKISERSSDTGKSNFSQMHQALPVHNPIWPESSADPEARNTENEWNTAQADIRPDTDHNKKDLDSPFVIHPQNNFHSPSVKPVREILPERITNTILSGEKTNEYPKINPVLQKEGPPVFIPRERTTLIEKIFERTVSGNIPVMEMNRGISRTDFTNKEITATGHDSFLPSRQIPWTESQKVTIQPGVRNQPLPVSRKAIPEKTQMWSFMEPGGHQQTTGKKEAENKLIIGRITVEVTQPATTPVPSPAPQRQYAGSGFPVNEMNTIDKLSFGLGQL